MGMPELHTVDVPISNREEAVKAFRGLVNAMIQTKNAPKIISEPEIAMLFWSGATANIARNFCDAMGVPLCENGCNDCPRRTHIAVSKVLDEIRMKGADVLIHEGTQTKQ